MHHKNIIAALVLAIGLIADASMVGMKKTLEKLRITDEQNEQMVTLEQKKKQLQKLLEDVVACAYTDAKTLRSIFKKIIPLFKNKTQDEKFELFKVTVKDKTAFGWAVVRENFEIAEQLENLRPDKKYELLKSESKDAVPSLHWLAIGCHSDETRALLEGLSMEQKYALFSMVDNDNYTALHNAAFCGNLVSIKLFFEPLISRPELWFNAQTLLDLLNMKTKNGKTLLELAESHNHSDIVKYLKEVQRQATSVANLIKKNNALAEATVQNHRTQSLKRFLNNVKDPKNTDTLFIFDEL